MNLFKKVALLLVVINLSVYSFDGDYESPFETFTDAHNPGLINDLQEKNGLPAKSKIQEMLELHTGAKSQGKRGTCTMFSTVGILEHLLIKEGLYSVSEIDLSEEYMEYIIMKDKQSEGSSTSRNLNAVKKYGFVYENTWPYVGQKWPELDDFLIARETCGHLEGTRYERSCLLGHRDPRLMAMSDKELRSFDPEFLKIRNEGKELKYKYVETLYKKRKSHKLKYVSSVKKLINRGQSVIMGTKLYYGSWNSSKTTKLDIQERDKEKFYRGIVTYPEPGTRDRRISGEKGGGHSIIIVGYDDNKVVTSRMKMEDGTWKEFKYKGVYYFKNSWGTKGFGKRSDIDGVTKPGFGMITQKYAHEFGSFFQIN